MEATGVSLLRSLMLGDVFSDAFQGGGIADDMVVIFFLPEDSGATEVMVQATGRDAFPAFHYFRQGVMLVGNDQRVRMIRSDDPFIQSVAIRISVSQAIGHNVVTGFIFEVATAMTGIEPPLKFSGEFSFILRSLFFVPWLWVGF